MKICVEIKPDPEEQRPPCEVEMFFDREGLEYFIGELMRLSKAGDHVHMMTPAWGMDDLAEEKQLNEHILVHHLKITMI